MLKGTLELACAPKLKHESTDAADGDDCGCGPFQRGADEQIRGEKREDETSTPLWGCVSMRQKSQKRRPGGCETRPPSIHQPTGCWGRRKLGQKAKEEGFRTGTAPVGD